MMGDWGILRGFAVRGGGLRDARGWELGLIASSGLGSRQSRGQEGPRHTVVVFFRETERRERTEDPLRLRRFGMTSRRNFARKLRD